jgi:hypothetical protein
LNAHSLLASWWPVFSFFPTINAIEQLQSLTKKLKSIQWPSLQAPRCIHIYDLNCREKSKASSATLCSSNQHCRQFRECN